MAVIPVGSQIFDLAFHPSSNVVYTGLLNGKVKAFTYDDQGAHSEAFSLRISKRSCRGLALSPNGSSLYAVGMNRTLQCVPPSYILVRCINVWLVPLTRVREPCRRHARACTSECYRLAGASMNPVYPRSAPINRVVHPTPHLLATGDDDGTIKVSVLISFYSPLRR
jgi:WD40 repeat protein